MATVDKVKVLVVGDSGVGKSSLTQLIAQGEPVGSAAWTVGASVEVKLHEYKEGTPAQRTFFIELWDIGGSTSHRNTRSVFYNGVHGVILVHDVTNRKSLENLRHWLAEVLNKEANSKGKQYYDDFDTEQAVGSSMIPMLVVGTKTDLAGEQRLSHTESASLIGDDWGADKIFLNCRESRSLAPGTSTSVKLSRFFDKVIEVRLNRREYLSPKDGRAGSRQVLGSIQIGSSPIKAYKAYHND